VIPVLITETFAFFPELEAVIRDVNREWIGESVWRCIKWEKEKNS
jgi:hypothetical protein